MRKLKAKMGFFDLAKHGLNKHGFKDQNWSHVLGQERNRRERRAKGGKKRKWKKKKKRSQGSQGMETNLDHGIVWIKGILRLCMIDSLSPNLGF